MHSVFIKLHHFDTTITINIFSLIILFPCPHALLFSLMFTIFSLFFFPLYVSFLSVSFLHFSIHLLISSAYILFIRTYMFCLLFHFPPNILNVRAYVTCSDPVRALSEGREGTNRVLSACACSPIYMCVWEREIEEEEGVCEGEGMCVYEGVCATTVQYTTPHIIIWNKHNTKFHNSAYNKIEHNLTCSVIS